MKNKLFMLFVFFGCSMFSQQQLSLENLNDFKDQAGNWFVVSDVTVNRNIDVHYELNKKRKTKSRKRKNKNKVELLRPVTYTSGTGILLNLNNEEKKDALITKWEHGDIKLELEVMIPKGSNSGIYLQGRYELQLFDSWGVKNPKYSDIGGIYRNWETNPEKIVRGVPPSSNAAKAPGLWQKLSIHFEAPRFTEAGQKISNAKFVYVELNGVRIHSNVEVPLYTGGQISKEEVARGPLMIQGDHGAIAFRNISYQLIEESTIELTSLTYKTYNGYFKGIDELDIDNQPNVFGGKATQIDIRSTGEEDNYGIVYVGKLNIPEEENYIISIGYTGGIKLLIDNKIIRLNNTSDSKGITNDTIHLSAGVHSFSLTNIKSAAWRTPALGLTIESATKKPKVFNTYESYPPSVNLISPIFVDADSRPRFLRGFVNFNNDSESSLSHTIGVGTIERVNFIYDLESANLIGAWRGNFIDATPMWHDRGNGSFEPRGAVQWTFLNQPIAELENAHSTFPKTGTAPDFISKGYIIDPVTNLPIFKHEYKGVKIENKITVDKTNTYLIHQISFSKSELTNWYFKLASGKIQKMLDGSYAIGDKQYYIKILSGQTPVVRKLEEETELVLSVNGNDIKYEIIW